MEHCKVLLYSTLYAAHGGRRKKKWLKHVLLPWVVHYCGCRLSSRDASPISMLRTLSSRIRNMDPVCRESSEVSGLQAQRPRQANNPCHQNVKEYSILCNWVLVCFQGHAKVPCTIADINIL